MSVYDETEVYHAVEKLTPFLWVRRRKDEQGSYYLHWCQGCGHAHSYPVGSAYPTNWQFNSNPQSPCFSPSMRIYVSAHNHEDGTSTPERTICHYFLTDGQIRYQGDCRHSYNGQTLPLQPIPEDYGF